MLLNFIQDEIIEVNFQIFKLIPLKEYLNLVQ